VVSGGPLRAVLFDWDGTLANSAEASFRCYVKLFGSFGIGFDRDAYARTYSPNWHFTYTALGLPKDDWEEADRRWNRFYGEEPSALIEGVLPEIDRLHRAGLVQGIVTSGERQRVGREVAELGLSRYFPVVVCSQDVVNRKPHPEALELALSRLKVAAPDAAYVGDSPEDVKMARAAGAFAVGIPGGFPNRPALAASNPDFLAESLAAAVDRLLQRVASG
jgi:HAD superfamily hydrolase (TIGR01549 family)